MNRVLIGILVFAFLFRIYNINYNTPFLDEAQYIAVGLKILSGDFETGFGGISWIGGSPFMYPLLSAIFYSIGGIVGSRFFMVILGTISVFLMYQLTKQLLFFGTKQANERAGLIAAAFMTITTIAIITSRIAIYDGLAFTLFLLGVVFFHKAIYTGERRFYLWSAVILFLSFLAKYIVLIYFPVLIMVPVVLAIRLKKKIYLDGISRYFCLPFLLLTGIYIGANFVSLRDFFIDQGILSQASESRVMQLFTEYTGVSYVLAFLGIPLIWRRRQFLILLLLALSFIPLVVHGVTGNDSSVQQHTFLSLIFIVPILGAIFASVLQKRKRLGIMLLAMALLIQIFYTVPQVKSAESFWPNITEPVAVLKKDLKPSDRILAEADDSLFLEVRDRIPQDQVSGPFYFSYQDKEGIEAYLDALNNGYFQYVQLEGTYFSKEDINAIKGVLQQNFRKIFDNGYTQIYKLNS
jgi:4-amino-4-deoxy-L-arabinose transferase-like glycosyltransferase